MTTLKCPGCRSVVTDDTCPKCTTDSEDGPFYGECIYVLDRGPRASQECSKPFMRLVGDGLMCQRHDDLEAKRSHWRSSGDEWGCVPCEQDRLQRQFANLLLGR